MLMRFYFWMLIVVIVSFPLCMLRWFLVGVLSGEKFDIRKILKRATVEWVVVVVVVIVFLIHATFNLDL